MHFDFTDFNGAGQYFGKGGAAEWRDLRAVLTALPAFFQASDQRGRAGSPIFDPKATNAFLTAESLKKGWRVVPVPLELAPFGDDWDAGKRATLAEWQFSNYPFLWNNVIRTEAIFRGRVNLPGLDPVAALVIVTKSGVFPASNSTLYYEQAVAQVGTVTRLRTFSVPIRVVGLTVRPNAQTLPVTWTRYKNPRYDRAPASQAAKTLRIIRRKRNRKYGTPNARFELE